MKRRIFSFVIVLVAVMLFAVSCGTGGGENTPTPPEGDYIFAEGSELYLIHDHKGDMLCERVNGKSIVWFCRNKEQLLK